MTVKFKKKPICEKCKAEDARSFSFFVGEGWKFCGDCTSESEAYYVMIPDFFKSSASVVDWIAHLHEKNWFKGERRPNRLDVCEVSEAQQCSNCK